MDAQIQGIAIGCGDDTVAIPGREGIGCVLVEKGADVNLAAVNGITPLMAAARAGGRSRSSSGKARPSRAASPPPSAVAPAMTSVISPRARSGSAPARAASSASVPR